MDSWQSVILLNVMRARIKKFFTITINHANIWLTTVGLKICADLMEIVSLAKLADKENALKNVCLPLVQILVLAIKVIASLMDLIDYV